MKLYWRVYPPVYRLQSSRSFVAFARHHHGGGNRWYENRHSESRKARKITLDQTRSYFERIHALTREVINCMCRVKLNFSQQYLHFAASRCGSFKSCERSVRREFATPSETFLSDLAVKLHTHSSYINILFYMISLFFFSKNDNVVRTVCRVEILFP